MDTNDYFQLIELVEESLRKAGASALSDPELYIGLDPETDEWQRYPPKDHLIEMLRAFDRHLAIYDRTTFHLALDRINEVTVGERLEGAVFIPTSEEGEGEPHSLGSAPELGELRDDVKRLIGELREDRDLGATEDR